MCEFLGDDNSNEESILTNHINIVHRNFDNRDRLEVVVNDLTYIKSID